MFPIQYQPESTLDQHGSITSPIMNNILAKIANIFVSNPWEITGTQTNVSFRYVFFIPFSDKVIIPKFGCCRVTSRQALGSWDPDPDFRG